MKILFLLITLTFLSFVSSGAEILNEQYRDKTNLSNDEYRDKTNLSNDEYRDTGSRHSRDVTSERDTGRSRQSRHSRDVTSPTVERDPGSRHSRDVTVERDTGSRHSRDVTVEGDTGRSRERTGRERVERDRSRVERDTGSRHSRVASNYEYRDTGSRQSRHSSEDDIGRSRHSRRVPPPPEPSPSPGNPPPGGTDIDGNSGSTQPISTPEPATMLLLGSGLLGLWGLRKKFKK